MNIAEVNLAGVDACLPVFQATEGLPEKVIETSHSWIFLTSRYAYKIKKPNGSRDRRQQCTDEVWLNRRLAPDVYLGIVALVRDSSGGLQLAGKGDPAEWAVKMRRLSDGCNMKWLLERQSLTTAKVTVLAQTLADFYNRSPPLTALLDDLYSRLRRRIEDRRLLGADLSAETRGLAREVQAVQLSFLQAAEQELALRVCDGRIVDGHGDLRPEHVFLERRPAIIDCLECSSDRKVDALDDLCGLSMECLRVGRGDVARSIMATYRECAGDASLPCLESFYRSLHAYKRAGDVVEESTREGLGLNSGRTALVASYLKQAASDVGEFRP